MMIEMFCENLPASEDARNLYSKQKIRERRKRREEDRAKKRNKSKSKSSK